MARLSAGQACSSFSSPAVLAIMGAEKTLSTPSAIRAFMSSPVLGNLAQSLKEELKFEKAEYKPPSEVARGPPAPFALTEQDGDTLLTFKRTYKDEEVFVDLQVNNQPAPEFEEGEGDLSTVVFNVSVQKGDNALVFECESDGTYMAITHLSMEPKAGVPSDSFYTGPVFEELDEELQKEFKSYLEERGINEDFGEFLRHLLYDKEQREYMNWLKKVHDFVA
jgi:hypothetical protein